MTTGDKLKIINPFNNRRVTMTTGDNAFPRLLCGLVPFLLGAVRRLTLSSPLLFSHINNKNPVTCCHWGEPQQVERDTGILAVVTRCHQPCHPPATFSLPPAGEEVNNDF
jgi:hypothetical protein